jgi:hypothetical protein
MRLERIEATPHPAGNRIDLSWVYTDPTFSQLRLVRRQGSHPVTAEPASAREGVVVADTQPATGQSLLEPDTEGVYRISDSGLEAEVVHYYSIYPYRGSPLQFHVDRHNRAAALATAPNDFAGLMYGLLPAIYHRFDRVLPRVGLDALSEVDQERGQLRRFLDLPGGELDRLYSFARALLDAHDPDKVDGRLLPLLAEWIGWKTDFRLELDAQRNEIRNAPAIYPRVGIAPVMASTIKRISGWESRTKELVHNIFTSNQPPRLNLWLAQRGAGGDWSVGDAPLSLNHAFDGRPAAARGADSTLHLFFQTPRKTSWSIWTKAASADGEWSPSEPLVDRGALDRHPSAARQGARLWLFWDTYDRTGRQWGIALRSLSAGIWSPIGPAPGDDSPFGSTDAERRTPAAATDADGGLWLFWQERDGAGWRLRYNRHDGAGWQLDPPAILPADAAGEPVAGEDLFVFAHPSDTVQRLWLLWARRQPGPEPEQTRWSLRYRVKGGLDPADIADWSAVTELAKAHSGHHEREPAVLAGAAGELEIFFAADRDGGWSVWRNTLGIAGVTDVADLSAHTWDPASAESVTGPPYAQRAPLPLVEGPEVLLVYRTNASLRYTSQVYGALETLDARYAGSTTAAGRDAAKLGLRGAFEDFQTYTFHAGETGRYAPDALGVYLSPDTTDPTEIARGEARLRRMLGEFIPATCRVLFLAPPA